MFFVRLVFLFSRLDLVRNIKKSVLAANSNIICNIQRAQKYTTIKHIYPYCHFLPHQPMRSRTFTRRASLELSTLLQSTVRHTIASISHPSPPHISPCLARWDDTLLGPATLMKQSGVELGRLWLSADDIWKRWSIRLARGEWSRKWVGVKLELVIFRIPWQTTRQRWVVEDLWNRSCVESSDTYFYFLVSPIIIYLCISSNK